MVSVIETGGLLFERPGELRNYNGFDVSKFSPGNYREYLLKYLIQRGLADESHSEFVFEVPKPHIGSQAVYFADYYIGDEKEHRVLISFLRTHAKSSEHYHREPLVEEYYPLAGQLYLNGEPIPPKGLIVAPNTTHRASTRDIKAITLIVMRNAGRFPENEQHVHIK